MAEIRNLTPHVVTVLDTDGATIAHYQPESPAARAEQLTEPSGLVVAGVPIHLTRFGAPTDLPAPRTGVWLIVSHIVVQAAAAAGRTQEDLLIAAEPVRNETGQIVGCRALALMGARPLGPGEHVCLRPRETSAPMPPPGASGSSADAAAPRSTTRTRPSRANGARWIFAGACP